MEVGNLEDIHFKGFWDWFVHWYPVGPLWRNQPTYLISQADFLLGALLSLTHALKGGGRLCYLWMATVLHGLVLETLCYVAPDVDNFWHSQTPVVLLGRRLPLHILFLYPCFIYQASVAAAQLRLPKWAEPFAVGLLVVLIDMPYDITCIKFLHWTWHDTDPNIGDRHYWVPWNSYYFHLSFAASFSFWFHGVRHWLDPYTPKWQASSFTKEVCSVVVAAVLGPLGGVLLFVPLYHPLHDLYNIHSEVTFFILLSATLLVVWTGDRAFKQTDTSVYMIIFIPIVVGCRMLLLPALLVHYSVYLAIVCFGQPEREISVGLHEPVGPCHLTRPVNTIVGTLRRRDFLCTEDYDEGYFDFHCSHQTPTQGAKWYTICGTPFENRPEYIVVILSISMVAFVVFWNAYFNSSRNSQKSNSASEKKCKHH